MRPIVLTIAGSDPSAGAGVQADLKAIEANGAYAVTAITAITVQSTTGVSRVAPVAADLVAAQLEALLQDSPVAAVKSGMLADAEIVRIVARLVRRAVPAHFVCDPVLRSTGGAALLSDDGVEALRSELIPLVDVLTPNAAEAGRLAELPVESSAQAERAAQRILSWGARAVLVTGGHLRDRPVNDLLVTPDRTVSISGTFVETPHTHGTGCALSAAIAARLACGLELEQAIRAAKDWLTEALRHALPSGRGAGSPDALFALHRHERERT
jgi:hydroxymethylpyrimidine/phosphomethylpyrimidine kinase